MKKLAIVLATVTAVFGFGAAAHAQYTDPPGVTVSDSSPPAGGTFTVSVSGCQPGGSVSTTFNGTTTAGTAGADGTASVSLTAPSTAGTFNGSVTCNGQTTNFAVTVAAPAGGLPATGSDGVGTTTMMAMGVFVIGLGLFGVAQVRRRQSAAA